MKPYFSDERINVRLPPGKYKILNNSSGLLPREWDGRRPGCGIPPDGDAYEHRLPPLGWSSQTNPAP